MTALSESINPLANRAILAMLTIREWRATRHDKTVTERVAREHGAREGTGRFTKLLLPKDALAQVGRIRTEARTFHYLHTLPWLDDGFRILTSESHLHYMEAMRGFRERYEAAVADFLRAYPEARKTAREALGTLYREADYPDTHALRDAFGLRVRLQPVPDGGDWRTTLPEDEVERIREDLRCQNETALRTAMADLYT
ncbi:MAG: hypothetical protein M3O15_12850, partial [Acidobacteriota bacterium]|nr:hypothetical protein [Acidobacteriota bacterium]